jgi:hypothetical protein
MTNLKDLLARMQALENEWVQELHRLREVRGYHLEGRRIRIEAATRKAHRLRRKRLFHYFRDARFSAYLTGPVIWCALVPTLLLDAYITLYQWVCFPAYGIPKVKRSEFIVMDRHHLPYLNGFERLNCFYCSYFNGLIAYIQEIAARTEQHWCPIKHARGPRTLHSRYSKFFDYGDAETFRQRFEALRRDFADLGTDPGLRK